MSKISPINSFVKKRRKKQHNYDKASLKSLTLGKFDFQAHYKSNKRTLVMSFLYNEIAFVQFDYSFSVRFVTPKQILLKCSHN